MSAVEKLGAVGEAALQSRSLDRRHPFLHASDAELVAALTGGSLVEAAALIERFGSLHRLARAAEGELTNAGLSAEAAIQLSVGVALGLRVAEKRFEPGEAIRHPTDVIDRYRPKMMLADRESMMALLLDTRKQVIGEMEISLGQLNAANMTPREVFAHALRENAACLILVHNHPAGSSSPSEADKRFTEIMVGVGQALKIEVVDSIVVAQEGGVSLRQEAAHLFIGTGGGYRRQISKAATTAAAPIHDLIAEP